MRWRFRVTCEDPCNPACVVHWKELSRSVVTRAPPRRRFASHWWTRPTTACCVRYWTRWSQRAGTAHAPVVSTCRDCGRQANRRVAGRHVGRNWVSDAASGAPSVRPSAVIAATHRNWRGAAGQLPAILGAAHEGTVEVTGCGGLVRHASGPHHGPRLPSRRPLRALSHGAVGCGCDSVPAGRDSGGPSSTMWAAPRSTQISLAAYLFFLNGFRNCVSVVLNWALAYWTDQRGAYVLGQDRSAQSPP